MNHTNKLFFHQCKFHMYHYYCQIKIIWKHFYAFYLDWLFMFVLPMARDDEPLERYDAISSFVLTSASVTPASVIPPFTVSLICMGTLAGTATFAVDVTSPLDELGSSKSKTSSLNIYQFFCRSSFKSLTSIDNFRETHQPT